MRQRTITVWNNCVMLLKTKSSKFKKLKTTLFYEVNQSHQKILTGNSMWELESKYLVLERFHGSLPVWRLSDANALKQVRPISSSETCRVFWIVPNYAVKLRSVSSAIAGGLWESNLAVAFLQSSFIYLVTNTEVSFCVWYQHNSWIINTDCSNTVVWDQRSVVPVSELILR